MFLVIIFHNLIGKYVKYEPVFFELAPEPTVNRGSINSGTLTIAAIPYLIPFEIPCKIFIIAGSGLPSLITKFIYLSMFRLNSVKIAFTKFVILLLFDSDSELVDCNKGTVSLDNDSDSKLLDCNKGTFSLDNDSKLFDCKFSLDKFLGLIISSIFF